MIADRRRDILEDYVRIYARRDHERACRWPAEWQLVVEQWIDIIT